jgi:ribosome modulation factor
MVNVRPPRTAPAPQHHATQQTPYNEGWAHGADPHGDHSRCPFVSPLVEQERAEWLRGFAAGRRDRSG